VLFDMRTARYAVSEQHGRCLLQLWSDERNLMRTVVEAQERAQCLRLMTRRMGAAKPQALELVPTSDRRTPDGARRGAAQLSAAAGAGADAAASSDRRWMGCARRWTWSTALGRRMCAGGCCAGTAADAVIGVGEAESARWWTGF
jgi:hypothetical protein